MEYAAYAYVYAACVGLSYGATVLVRGASDRALAAVAGLLLVVVFLPVPLLPLVLPFVYLPLVSAAVHRYRNALDLRTTLGAMAATAGPLFALAVLLSRDAAAGLSLAHGGGTAAALIGLLALATRTLRPDDAYIVTAATTFGWHLPMPLAVGLGLLHGLYSGYNFVPAFLATAACGYAALGVGAVTYALVAVASGLASPAAADEPKPARSPLLTV